MKQTTARYLTLTFALVCTLLLAWGVAAQGNPPQIPHPLKDRERCLGCHDRGLQTVPQIPRSHKSYTVDLCRNCHTPASPGEEGAAPAEPAAAAVPHTLKGRENCLSCHPSPEAGVLLPGGPPAIPHTLIGRENCLACHSEGVGGAPVIPADHEGRSVEICQACHQPGEPSGPAVAAPVTGPVPTPIVHPAATGADRCVECHRTLEDKHVKLVDDWQASIHAERNVGCADCHGGDPNATTVDDAMSPTAGYIGSPAKKDIPALCASCHANVELMRQYNLSTDQYAQYQQSTHGLRLAAGDDNVATCADCHSSHGTLKANDPASTVYPANVPKLCASCHADKALMAPYDIPTNQFDLYRQSVHGHALIDQQDFRAPTCATCHGTHGAAPPGFQEVANVCGDCHSATQEYYLQSAHAKVDDGPKCVTCHGRYDVGKPSEALYLGSEPRHCGSCHDPDTDEGRTVGVFYDMINEAAVAYDEAETSIGAAKRLGMLVAPQEALMSQANTALVTARAAQHEVDAKSVLDMTTEAKDLANQAEAEAKESLAQSRFRREAMVVAVAAIGLTIVALYMLKRELERRQAD